MLLVASLAELDTDTDGTVAWEHLRDHVLVAKFGGREGFGDGTVDDEHRFRIDDHWSLDA
jgi:hypothetical protein